MGDHLLVLHLGQTLRLQGAVGPLDGEVAKVARFPAGKAAGLERFHRHHQQLRRPGKGAAGSRAREARHDGVGGAHRKLLPGDGVQQRAPQIRLQRRVERAHPVDHVLEDRVGGAQVRQGFRGDGAALGAAGRRRGRAHGVPG